MRLPEEIFTVQPRNFVITENPSFTLTASKMCQRVIYRVIQKEREIFLEMMFYGSLYENKFVLLIFIVIEAERGRERRERERERKRKRERESKREIGRAHV